jgi:5-methyltetrahydropteroyltriglutamate--homocysteine methyltransferase
LTTHVGSLARPKDLLKMMDAKLKGRSYDSEAYDKRVRSAVTEVVRKQVECGVDIVTELLEQPDYRTDEEFQYA